MAHILILRHKEKILPPCPPNSPAFAAGLAPFLAKIAKFGKINPSAMANDRFDIKQRKSVNILTETMIIVDKETGVNYLYVARGYGGGLTPLIDADGKPIITKDGYKK